MTTIRAVHLGGPAEFACERVLPALAPLVSGGLRLRMTFGMPDDLVASLTGGGLDLMVSTVRVRHRGLRAEPPINTLFLVWREGYLHPAARRVQARCSRRPDPGYLEKSPAAGRPVRRL